MPLPVIAFFAAAGLAAAGGPLAGVYFFRRGAQEAARQEARAHEQAIRSLLEEAIDTAELRNRALEAGVDPDAVIDGYQALQRGYLSLEDLIRRVQRGEEPVPVSGGSQRALPSGSEYVEISAAEIRTWARDNGYEVAETGRLSNEVISAYRQAHLP